MTRRLTLLDRFYRTRSQYRRTMRLLFPSPAEVRFMELLGARILTIKRLHVKPNGFCFTLVLSRGKILRRAGMKREVRYGRYYVDFANDLNWIIEVDGTRYHQDVVKELDREIYINNLLQKNPYGVRLKRVRAPRLWNDRARLQRELLEFLSA